MLKIFLTIILLFVVGISAFFLGRFSNTPITQIIKPQQYLKNTYSGKVYEISYPWNWTFEGPSEGPITGFPEFSKLLSPSGDTQIIIGLKGDNRFEFLYDDIRSKTEATTLTVGNKTYSAEEEFLDINEDPEYNVVILEAEITDAKVLGQSRNSLEALLPLKVQILYRFSTDQIPVDQKIKMYESEQQEALEILQTFRLINQ